MHTGDLVVRELVHAVVVNVVHEVVDRVHTRIARARVPVLGATVGRRAFLRRVVAVVVGNRAAALEGVVQAEIVAGLVRDGVAFVVRDSGAARQRGVQRHHAVQGVVFGVHVRERGVPEQAATDVRDPDVEVRSGLVGRGRLHVGRLAATVAGRRPLGIVIAVDQGAGKAEAGTGVRGVQHVQLGVDLSIGNVAGTIVHGDHMERDGNHDVGLLAGDAVGVDPALDGQFVALEFEIGGLVRAAAVAYDRLAVRTREDDVLDCGGSTREEQGKSQNQ